MEKFIQQINVQSHHTDQYGKASICSLFHFMLEAAWAHAQIMDWGYEQLQSHNMFWVLSRMYVVVEKYPSWQETITLHTWSAGTDGMYAYREFILQDSQGNIFLRANTAWLILDTQTKKIVLLKDRINSFPRLRVTAACREPGKIRQQKVQQELRFSPVRFSELDINRHFNSVKALERVLDHFGVDFLNEREPESIEINYIKEGLAGDHLAVSTTDGEEYHSYASIIRKDDNMSLSNMKISWRTRKK